MREARRAAKEARTAVEEARTAEEEAREAENRTTSAESKKDKVSWQSESGTPWPDSSKDLPTNLDRQSYEMAEKLKGPEPYPLGRPLETRRAQSDTMTLQQLIVRIRPLKSHRTKDDICALKSLIWKLCRALCIS